jgi:putative membrane protein
MKSFFFRMLVVQALAAACALPASAEHATSAADRQFVLNAATAGAEEVRDGKAELHSTDAGARMFAGRMVADHGRAGKQLQMLAEELGLSKQLQRGIAAAAPAAAVPGAQYLSHEVSAHQTAIALFEREAASGTNPNLRSFARTSLPMLRTHLELARRLSATP